MTRYHIVHSTQYHAESRVSVCHNQAWLRPRDTVNQSVVSHDLKITPEPSTMAWRDDVFGNHLATLSFNDGYANLVVRSESVVDVDHPQWQSLPAENWEVTRDLVAANPTTRLKEYEFCFPSKLVRTADQLADYARQDFRPGRTTIDALVDLTHRIHTEFEYDPRATTISTPVEYVFEHKKGVCQDFAHVQIAMLRSLGIPARYVSGYVRTGNVPDRPDMIGADASHAWLAVYCSKAGWINADPTNDALTSKDHVTVAWGRDYSDTPPFRGVFIGGGQHSLDIGVSVTPIDPEPGVS